MNILIIGFQRSGTTLLRRLLQMHPQVDKIFHESFFLSECNTKEDIMKHVDQRGFDIHKGNWGEKVPYFPNIKKIPVKKYCDIWNRYFGGNSRILHIIRHPYSCALSNVKKFKNIHNTDKPINLYKRSVPKAVKDTMKMKSVYTFKYEDLLLNQEEMMFNIYKHCGVKPDIDFKKIMKKWKNPKYQTIDSSRAFAFEQEKLNYNLKNEIIILNKIGKVEYKI
jgi:hypothetical protein